MRHFEAVQWGVCCCSKLIPTKKWPFKARPIEGSDAPQDASCDYLILDGQQRITALWRALRNTEKERRYFIKYRPSKDDDGEVTSRRKTNKQAWLNDPKKCLGQGLVPVTLLRHPLTGKRTEVRSWVDKACAELDGSTKDLSAIRDLEDWIKDRSEALRTFIIPFLAMPEDTSGDEAIETFIESNTSSQHLRKFDIVTGQMHLAHKSNLREARRKACERVTDLESYLDESDVGDLLLKIACLRKGQTPVESNYTRSDVMADIKENIDAIINGLTWTITLLEEDGIWDKPRLPSVVPFRVLPALHSVLPAESTRRAAANKIARAYLWRAFLTERYGSTAATLLREDYDSLREVFQNPDKSELSSVPIWNADEYPLPTTSDLLKLGWPTHLRARARALLAITLRCGARDIGSNRKVSKTDITDRQYHHLFPQKYLKNEAPDAERDLALNCVLIEAKTNRQAADKPPLEYLKTLLVQVGGLKITERDIKRRLESHLVPASQLGTPAIRPVLRQYEEYLKERAGLVFQHMQLLADGEEP